MLQGYLKQKDYNFVFGKTPRLCVDLIIKDQRGVLLSYRIIEPANGTWHTPGGRVYHGESIAKAIARIAKAETGLTVTVEKFLGFMEFLKELKHGNHFHSVSMVFLCRPKKGIVTGSWQAEELKFFKMLPKNTFAIHSKFLKQNKILNR